MLSHTSLKNTFKDKKKRLNERKKKQSKKIKINIQFARSHFHFAFICIYKHHQKHCSKLASFRISLRLILFFSNATTKSLWKPKRTGTFPGFTSLNQSGLKKPFLTIQRAATLRHHMTSRQQKSNSAINFLILFTY